MKAMYLNLRDTQVKDIGSMSAQASLQTLNLYLDLRLTQVQGDIGSLSALASLQKLGLFDTQVTGDIGSLSALASLQSSSASSTSHRGGHGSPRAAWVRLHTRGRLLLLLPPSDAPDAASACEPLLSPARGLAPSARRMSAVATSAAHALVCCARAALKPGA